MNTRESLWLKNIPIDEMGLSEEVLKNLDERRLSTLNELINIFPINTQQFYHDGIKKVIGKLKNHLWDGWESQIITPNINKTIKDISHEIAVTIEKMIQREVGYQWREKNPTIDSNIAYDIGIDGSAHEELYHGRNSGLPITEANEESERILFVEGVKMYDKEKSDNHKH